MADLTFFFRLMAFSMYWASRFRMVSRMPPASPASTMLA